MISYHPRRGGAASAYASGFRLADTNSPERLARGIAGYVWSPCIWEGGERRKVNFLRADWAVLDFDSGELPLAQALRVWADAIHIIGTTRNHRREKDGKPPCDRFRVALLFEQTVTSLRDYEHTMAKLIDLHGADAAAKDGARFFYPCREIVSINMLGCAEVPLRAPPPGPLRERLEAYRYARWSALPNWVERFLTQGATVAKGRQHTAYCAARKLTELGLPPLEIEQRILGAPYDRTGIVPGEIERAIANGIAAARSGPHG